MTESETGTDRVEVDADVTRNGNAQNAVRTMLPVMESSIDQHTALSRIAKKLTIFERWYAGISSPPVIKTTELYFKPYFLTPARQRKRFGINNFEEMQIYISVDGLTGVASVLRDPPECGEVPHEDLQARGHILDPAISEERALNRTQRRQTHVEVRTKSQVKLEGSPVLIYKPIWFIELEARRRRRFAVDSVNGYVLQE